MLGKKETSFSLNGLSAGSYSFKLWSMNAKGSSPASDIVSTVLA